MKILALSILALSAAVQAAEPPAPSYGLYGERTKLCFNMAKGVECTGEAANTLLITPIENKSLALVNLNLIFFNGHTCGVSDAIGEWHDKSILVKLNEPVSCEFRIKISSNSATLEDSSDMPCTSHVCGVRGNLNGVVLPLKGAL